jgi:hypothetical protein
MVVACLAAATSATASAAEFHSEALPTKIQGTQTAAHVYKFGETSVTCDLATVEGTLTNKTTIEMTLIPAYANNCDFMVGLIKYTVGTAINGCTWKLWANGTENIQCPTGKAMEFSYSGCTWKIGAQTLEKAVSYANNGKHIDYTWNLSGIKYTYSGSACGTGTAFNGSYAGTSTVVGRNWEGKEVSIWWL